MKTLSLEQVSITGIAACVPSRKESNTSYEHISEQERSLLIKTTGVKERRIADSLTTASDLCAKAANALLNELKISRNDIGILVFASQSGDYYLPSSACILQNQLELPTSTLAFDIGLGCSGYVYGLTIIASMMNSLGIKKGLLLAGDVSTIVCSPEDKSTYPIFGDAGSATLIENGKVGNKWHLNMFTDGGGYDNIIIPDGRARNKISEKSFISEAIAPGIQRNRLNLILKGPEIFSFAVSEVPKAVERLLYESDLKANEIDYFVMHQANKIINETIRKKLGIPDNKTPYSLDEYGNTSSASIPLTMVSRLQNSLSTRKVLLLSGFGVGLSWGNILMQTEGLTCLPVMEYSA